MHMLMHFYICKWHKYSFLCANAQIQPFRVVMENLLHNASRDGDVEKVKELLENGADVQSVDKV